MLDDVYNQISCFYRIYPDYGDNASRNIKEHKIHQFLKKKILCKTNRNISDFPVKSVNQRKRNEHDVTCEPQPAPYFNFQDIQDIQPNESKE